MSSINQKAFVYNRGKSKNGNPNFVVVIGELARGKGGKIRTLRSVSSAEKLAELHNEKIVKETAKKAAKQSTEIATTAEATVAA